MSTESIRPQVGRVVQEAAQPLLAPLSHFLWGWTKWLAPWLAGVCLIVIAYGYFCQWRDRPIKFLIGPRGSGSANQAELLQREFEKDWSLVGPNYFVTPVFTDGFVENYRQVNADSKGNMVGYAMDGLSDGRARDVQTILPMEWEYLHFVLLTDSWKKIAPNWSSKANNGIVPPVAISEWIANVRGARNPHGPAAKNGQKSSWPICLYLGPRGSATRSVANAVLEYANIPAKDVEAIGVADFQEMLVALRQQKIDGGFYMGSRDAESIKSAARDLNCILISMDIAPELTKTITYLEPGTIPAGAYEVGADGHIGDVKTLAMRRVLVASKYMDAGDAYRIAQHVRQVLPHRVPTPVSEGRYPDPDDGLDSTALNFAHHSGMLTNDSGPAPPSFIDRHAYWLVPLLLTVAIGAIGAWKGAIAEWLNGHHPDSPPPGVSGDRAIPPASPEQADIAAEIARILKAMHDTEDDLIIANHAPTKATLDNWRQQVGDVYRRIHAVAQAKKLTAAQSLALKEGAYQLQQELEVLRDPPWHTPPPRKRRASKPKGGSTDKSNEGNRS